MRDNSLGNNAGDKASGTLVPQPPPSCSPGRGPKSPSQPNFANKVIFECFFTDFKGVGLPWRKKIFIEFIVGFGRVAQDKLFGVGMTLLRPRVCH